MPAFEYRDSNGYPLVVGQVFSSNTRQAGATFVGVTRYIPDRKLAQYAWRWGDSTMSTDWSSVTRINNDLYRIVVDTRPVPESKTRLTSRKALGSFHDTSPTASLKASQEFIFRVAAQVDPRRAWNQPSNITGAIDNNTVNAAQVILYKAEQIEPLPNSLVVLLQPAQPKLWVEVLKAHLDEFVDYASRTVGSESRPLTKAGKLFIAGTAGVLILFVVGIKQLAKAEDRHGWLVKYQ